MIDPYKVLDISPGATPDEIKKAYRKKALQYHPDRNQGSKEAEERMKEINEAYAMLTDPNYKANNRAHSAGGYGYGGQGYAGGWGGFDPFSAGFGSYRQTGYQDGGSYAPELQAARNYVMNGYYQEALNALESIKNRTAEWYYLSAQAQIGMGNRVTAREHAMTACRMNPENFEYRMLLEQIEAGAAQYRSRGDIFNMSGAICQNPCLQCVAANVFLNCLCGGLRFC